MTGSERARGRRIAASDARGTAVGRSRRAALRRVADHQRMQPRMPALHRGERAGQGLSRRAATTTQCSRVLDQLIDAGRSRTCRSRAASRWCIRTSSRWSSTPARAAAAQDRDQRPLSRRRRTASACGARREGGAGEPRRRVARDVQPDAGAGRIQHRRRGHDEPARRRRADRDQLFPDPLQHRTRSARPSTSRTSLARTASTRAARCTPGNAVKTWRIVAPSEEQYAEFFDVLHAKADEYRGRMRVHFHEMGLLEELRYRLQHPAALLIVLPNGLVKLINALPFVCGDLRTQSLRRHLGQFPHAWHDPRVARFIDDLAVDPRKTSTLHKWVYSEHAVERPARRAPTPTQRLLRVVSLVRYRFFLYAGLLPYLLGAAWAYAIAGRSMPRSSGADFSASCWRSSAWKRSTNTSTHGWGPTASSIPRTCRRSRSRSSGSASPRLRAHWPSACI